MARRRMPGPSLQRGEALSIPRRKLLQGAAVVTGALLLGRADRTGASAAGAGLLAPRRAPRLAASGLGPSSSVQPYLLPSLPDGVEATAILTAGDSAENGYRMVGNPDGLGVLPDGPTFSVFMNHELPRTAGIPRAHGSSGAFVSKWVIERETLRVLSGQDLTPSPNHVFRWDPAARRYTQGTVAWDRLCSADLPASDALHFGGRGTAERIFFDGDETATGRAWARIVTGPRAGTAWELPRLGKMAYENVVACPHPQAKTVVALLDDGALDTAPIAENNPSEVYIYVGTKQAEGTEIEQAGLTNGKFYGVRVSRGRVLVEEESDEFGLGDSTIGYIGRARFDLVEVGPAGDVSALSNVEIEQSAIANGVCRLQRVEDGAWDPRPSLDHTFYFVTTASISPLRNSRLWCLTFDDIERPEAGGTIELLLTNTPGRMFDNITIDGLGRLLIQEDTGNSPWVSKVWLYGIDLGALVEIAHHDPGLFEPAGARLITQDEESSGIIDAESVLGPGWFLLDVQVNQQNTADRELVQGGQLVALYVDPRIGR
jgi:hypothetical protein